MKKENWLDNYIPKAQVGGKTNIATQQDSLDLYNNAKLVDDFYNKSGKYRRDIGKEKEETYRNPNNYNLENDSANFTLNQNQNLHNISTRTNTGERLIKPDEYRKDLDNNRYYQRELAAGILNTDAPMQLFDKRITPQYPRNYSYAGKDINDPLKGDKVQVYQYDPIAIKPWNMESPEEQKERVKKYSYPQGAQSPIWKPQHTTINSLPATGINQLPTNIQNNNSPIVNAPTQQDLDPASYQYNGQGKFVPDQYHKQMGYLDKYDNKTFQNGGLSTEGYKRNSPDRNRDFNVIPSNNITMKNVDYPILALSSTGEQRMMYPGEQHYYPGADYVHEIPVKKNGGKSNKNWLENYR